MQDEYATDGGQHLPSELEAELYRAVVGATRRRRRSRREHATQAQELHELYDRNRNLLESLPNE